MLILYFQTTRQAMLLRKANEDGAVWNEDDDRLSPSQRFLTQMLQQKRKPPFTLIELGCEYAIVAA